MIVFSKAMLYYSFSMVAIVWFMAFYSEQFVTMPAPLSHCSFIGYYRTAAMRLQIWFSAGRSAGYTVHVTFF